MDQKVNSAKLHGTKLVFHPLGSDGIYFDLYIRYVCIG
jgi:hypothetical protein